MFMGDGGEEGRGGGMVVTRKKNRQLGALAYHVHLRPRPTERRTGGEATWP